MYGHTGVFFNNKIVVFGGYNEDWDLTNDLNIYDLETKEWNKQEVIGDKPQKKGFSTMTCIDNKSFLFGGTSSGQIYVLDLLTYQWTLL